MISQRSQPDQPTASMPSWFLEAHRVLLGLGLPPEWPEESVSVPGSRSRRAAGLALRLLAEIGLRPDRLLPGFEGGVSITFTRPDRFAEVTFLDNGEVVATCAGGHPGRVRAWPVGTDLAGAFQTLHAFLED
jgi:hypothetical protein